MSASTTAPDIQPSPNGKPDTPSPAPGAAQVIPLRPPSQWHDPLGLLQNEAPGATGRIVLWAVSVLVLVLIAWAAFGQLDIVATADGKLVPQTLVKVVQPAEPGVVKQLLVNEGDQVKAGQVLARLDTTLASADKAGVASDLATQRLQERRIAAELADQPMRPHAGDDPQRFAQVQSQYIAHRQAYSDGLDQEKSLLAKAEHERRSAMEIRAKLEQTLPIYKRTAEAYAKLEKDGFMGGLAAADKQREATEKARDLDAQQSTVAALNSTIAAQQKKISQLQSTYQSELQRELADIRAKIQQLQPTLDKTIYKEGLMELRAPQDGTVKDLATTTVGAVVQPGTVVLTLVPKGEKLFADVSIKNEDVGFVQVGQTAQIKLATYPFQKYGMLTGKVTHISADATESAKPVPSNSNNNASTWDGTAMASLSTYRARVKLDAQTLRDPQGDRLALTSGMQVVAEINQGKRTVLEYLLSPVQKALGEAGRER
jgi:HlyD family secretion protein